MASLDNLGKGASGAAVQTINLKTGVDESDGADRGGVGSAKSKLRDESGPEEDAPDVLLACCSISRSPARPQLPVDA